MTKYHRGTPRYQINERERAEDRIEQLKRQAISTTEADAIEEIRERRFFKAMALKEELGLTDDERHELAQLLIGVDKDDGGSWKDLNPKQLHDLITMMEGWVYITHILSERA